MEKVLIVIIGVAVACMGCKRTPEAGAPAQLGEGLKVFSDIATGCEYLGFGRGDQGKALTARIATDGRTHKGCKGAAQ